jgi:aryl carrier-like protein
MIPTNRAQTPAAILAGIGEVAREHLGWEGAVTPEMRLVEDLRLDSIRLLTLAETIRRAAFASSIVTRERSFWAGRKCESARSPPVAGSRL